MDEMLWGNRSPDLPANRRLCVSLTCVFAALAAFDEAEDEQDEHQQHDGADESNQPTPGGEAPGNLRWH